MNGSPKIRRQRGTTRAREVGAERVAASFHGFRVVCVQRRTGLPYRCNGSKQIILANENAGLPAPVNVYDYEDSRAKTRLLPFVAIGSAVDPLELHRADRR